MEKNDKEVKGSQQRQQDRSKQEVQVSMQRNQAQIQEKLQRKTLKKIKHIRQQCLQQSKKFKKWSQNKQWNTFHWSHYDWWAFPIDQSSQKGNQFRVDSIIIQYLKKDTQFIEALKMNARYVCQSWGWSIDLSSEIIGAKWPQCWMNWSIRLYKMTKSMKLFECHKQQKSAIMYANLLIKKGIKLKSYGHREIQAFFQKQIIKLKIQTKAQIQKKKCVISNQKQAEQDFKLTLFKEFK